VVRTRALESQESRYGPLILIGTGLLLVLPFLGPSSISGPALATERATLIPATPLGLTVVPSDWWMAGGTSTTISATWTEIPPGCTVEPVWFQWSIGPGGSEGFVAPTNGSTANFTAVGVESGTTTVVVAGAADLTCGMNRTSAFRTADATFHVDAPLVIQEFRTVPTTPPSEGAAEVSGTIAGGEPPFTLAIDWGDGNVTTAAEAAGGNFSVVGEPGAGPFDPSIVVTDSAGLIARATVEDSVTVGDGFAISIVPSSYIAEVGLPVEFGLVSTAAPGEYSSAATCEDAVAGPRMVREGAPGAPDNAFSCAFAAPGIANVSVLAVDASFPYSTAYAQLLEPVEPELSIESSPAGTVGEVGKGSYVPLTIIGGVPPYRIHWRFVGNGSEENAIVPLDGTFLAPITPVVPGSEEIVAGATDALGEPAANASVPIVVEEPLAGDASAGGVPVAGGTGFLLSAAIVAGTPPFEWTVIPAVPLANETSPGGSLASAGSFAWTGTIRAEGNQTATLVVVDAAGKEWTSNLSVAAEPAMAVELHASAGPPGRWTGAIDISGGVAPFLLWVNGSDGESWNRSGLPDGSWSFTAEVLASGNLSVEVTVVDHLGITAHSTVSLAVTTGPGPAPPSDAGVVETAGVFGLAGGGLGWWWWRRSRSQPGVPELDPVATLRAIIAPADGADRAAVELLAEEQGIPLVTVRSSIDRLIANGTIRAERGSDGEEVLAWREGS
jgi:hypothetical protein